jgi:hypothetical protein
MAAISALLFAHKANINRYRSLLKTYLTDNERKFVERRIGEEEKALFEITREASFRRIEGGGLSR